MSDAWASSRMVSLSWFYSFEWTLFSCLEITCWKLDISKNSPFSSLCRPTMCWGSSSPSSGPCCEPRAFDGLLHVSIWISCLRFLRARVLQLLQSLPLFPTEIWNGWHGPQVCSGGPPGHIADKGCLGASSALRLETVTCSPSALYPAMAPGPPRPSSCTVFQDEHDGIFLHYFSRGIIRNI